MTNFNGNDMQNLQSTTVGKASRLYFINFALLIKRAMKKNDVDMRAAAGRVIDAIRSNYNVEFLVKDMSMNLMRISSDAERIKLSQLLRYVEIMGDFSYSYEEPHRQGETAMDLIRQARDTVTFINPMYFSCGLDSRQLKMYERALHTERKRKGSNCRKKLKQQWK